MNPFVQTQQLRHLGWPFVHAAPQRRERQLVMTTEVLNGFFRVSDEAGFHLYPPQDLFRRFMQLKHS